MSSSDFCLDRERDLCKVLIGDSNGLDGDRFPAPTFKERPNPVTDLRDGDNPSLSFELLRINGRACRMSEMVVPLKLVLEVRVVCREREEREEREVKDEADESDKLPISPLRSECLERDDLGENSLLPSVIASEINEGLSTRLLECRDKVVDFVPGEENGMSSNDPD